MAPWQKHGMLDMEAALHLQRKLPCIQSLLVRLTLGVWELHL